MAKGLSISIILTAVLILACPFVALAWPTSGQWQPLLKGGDVLQDAEADANGSVNVVPNDGSTPAAYIYNDGTYLFYRLRLDDDPSGNGGQGVLKQFGWGFEIDADQNPDDYEWLVMIDGISDPEVVSLRKNEFKTHIGDPSDKAEVVVAEYPLPGNHRILPADTSINGDQDYFLDFRIPYAVFLKETELTENSLIRYFTGSSKSTNNLTDNGADLVGGSDLYDGLGDYFVPDGSLPAAGTFTDGAVRFVEDIDGFGDMVASAAGDTVYLRVDDADQTANVNPGGTVPVILTAPSGDEERVVLTATGVSGKFTGSIGSAAGGAAPGDGTLQVFPDETVTVTYLDAVDASGNQNVARTDTLLFTAADTDLALNKTVDTDTAAEGDTVVFTITATNRGPHQATGIAVTESLPAGLTLVAATPSPGTGYYGGTWTIGALAVDAVVTLTLETTVDAGTSGQPLTNTASLAALDQNDIDANNDTAAATVYVGGTDLRVAKAVSDANPAPGATVEYTVRVVNLGPNDATGVAVADALPAGVTLQGNQATRGTYDAGAGRWNVGTLPAGNGAKLTLTVTVDAGTGGTIITNTASLADPESYPDTDPGNDSAAVQLHVGFLDLELAKTADKSSPNSGGQVVFTLSVANLGPTDATGVEVTDALPGGLAYVSDNGGGAYVPGTGVWTLGALDSGESDQLEITARVTAGPGQTVINSASITSSHPDNNAANDNASATLKVDGTDVGVTKTVDNATPAEGETVTYTITATNNGPVQATGVEVTDILPAGVSYDSHTESQGSYDAGKKNSDQVWSVGTLDIAQSETLTITATVDAGTSGDTITNLAMITASDQEDPDDGNNVADAAIAVNGTDLAVIKTVDDAAPGVGQNVVYTVTVTNNGPSGATGLEVTDLLPPELNYVGDDGGGTYDAGSGVWSVGALADGASATLQITAAVRPGTSGETITNFTEITALDQGDEDPSNDYATADIIVDGIDLAVTKTVNDASPAAGGDTVFTITLTNSGSFEATGVEVEDVLPPGLAFVSATPSQGTYSADIWLVGPITAGTSATLQITAAVGAGTAGDTLTNTAVLTAVDQMDTDAGNNSASVNIIPIAAPSLTVIKSASGPTAAPGDVITYTVTVLNAGGAEAANVVLTDDLSPYTAWSLAGYGAGQPFQLAQGSPASGLALGTAEFSDDEGASWSYTPVSGAGGAPVDYDGNVTDWRLPMTGTMPAGGSFTLRYQVRVK